MNDKNGKMSSYILSFLLNEGKAALRAYKIRLDENNVASVPFTKLRNEGYTKKVIKTKLVTVGNKKIVINIYNS